MDWQQVAALFIVALTVVIMVWSRLRPRKKQWQKRGGGCCGSAGHDPAPGRIVIRGRKGERPEVRVESR